MVSKKKINGWAAVALVFLVCAVVYGLLSSYPRELAVYSDELRYLDVARSLLQGRGLRVRNMPSDYQKILYPLCILPALLLRTTAAQITAIGWLNAVYMASAVFPAYALARAMGMNRRRTAFLVGVTAVLPTMSAASTFMSETVFLPLSLWQVYFFLRAMLAEPKARVGWCAAAGAFCYLLYLNKEVALYYLIAWVLVRAWVWWHDKASWRAELACNAALLGSFLACFVLAKVTLFRGLGNSYNQTGWLTGEQWRFLPFALVCDALFTVLAFWVYPVLLPLCGLHRPRRGSDARRTQLPLFLLLCLGIGVAVIAWSITVREDLQTVRDYLSIQEIRYGERLQVEYAVDDAVMPCHIPAMTVQPLVENAIHHAAEHMLDTCIIRISGNVVPDGIDVIVQDNGPGIDEDILTKLESGEVQPEGLGIGLRNIHKRVQHTFGKEYGLRIRCEDGCTQIIIHLPDTRPEKPETPRADSSTPRGTGEKKGEHRVQTVIGR